MDIIDINVISTYKYKQKIRYKLVLERRSKDTSRSYIMALFGLVYLIAVKRRNHLNAREL